MVDRRAASLCRGFWSSYADAERPVTSSEVRQIHPDALEVVKETLRRNVPPGEDDFMERINEASSLEDVHEFCGRRDFLCTAPCASNGRAKI